ncbi:nuclear egress lamina protein [Saimiriine betaherpesvirus 4]|uniref:Nuclear egress lamina protein n=1 Tax=Saimiriine betaherpesvirus 4 TaxID=1535247 RepID=G8XSW8_9BETA|nr:nuclear egress lamina protein [Saimiriine betaherpesvirus 4]AEV80914.1 nuclear egress lamina protein [Saimiriine betaherpesvirus 4]
MYKNKIRSTARRSTLRSLSKHRKSLSRSGSSPLSDTPLSHTKLTLHDLHDVFREYPDLELKYLNMMKMAITGKESICLPFNFQSHRQHTCLDISPYGNEQVSRIACTNCNDSQVSPTASDAMVAFINQSSNVMKNRHFYYGFCKDAELLRMSTNQPTLFQIYYILHSSNHDIVPFMYARNGRVHMHVIFENQDVHIPCECISQILSATKGDYSITLDIVRGHVVISATCHAITAHSVKIDLGTLQRKIDEMDIPNDISELFERYKNLLQELCNFHQT